MRLIVSCFLLLMITGVSLTACSTTSTPASSVKEAPASPIPEVHIQRTLENPNVMSVSEREREPEPETNTPAPSPETTVVQAAPSSATAAARKLKFDCTAGSKVTGQVDRWSPLSTCPAGYQVTGLGRIDLHGDHNRPNLHVNDFICDDRGCKAWCIGDGCTVEARCCRITD